MPTHVCPVCGKRHEVSPGLYQLSYGNQLTCGYRCKGAYRRVVLERRLAELERRELEEWLRRPRRQAAAHMD